MSRKTFWTISKVIFFILSLTPFLLLLYGVITDQLGANPIETLHFSLGDWALRFLCLGLAITPLKKITAIKELIRFRRMTGLFAFFYASLHFLVYIGLDLSFSLEQFIDEVPKSPYIIVGLFTYSLLIPLALTSTKGMQKRLGRQWQQLHKLVYLAAISAVVHYLWLVKLDLTEPLIYAALVFLLLGFRVIEPVFRKKYRAN
ncbi:MAG: sulfoxide reductase heme-binding subunit YedZ [Methylococcaceae bacterium]|nr:sulfoxide reductase heme-binding subunit YedZ [Methylococcaceae bacterium]